MRNVTIALMVLAFFLIALYDVIALLAGGTETTISAVIISWSKVYPILPFAFGVLMGHFFWQIDTTKEL
jgi:hypothetical protein